MKWVVHVDGVRERSGYVNTEQYLIEASVHRMPY